MLLDLVMFPNVSGYVGHALSWCSSSAAPYTVLDLNRHSGPSSSTISVRHFAVVFAAYAPGGGRALPHGNLFRRELHGATRASGSGSVVLQHGAHVGHAGAETSYRTIKGVLFELLETKRGFKQPFRFHPHKLIIKKSKLASFPSLGECVKYLGRTRGARCAGEALEKTPVSASDTTVACLRLLSHRLCVAPAKTV